MTNVVKIDEIREELSNFNKMKFLRRSYKISRRDKY